MVGTLELIDCVIEENIADEKLPGLVVINGFLDI